jgi:hypothetical protein
MPEKDDDYWFFVGFSGIVLMANPLFIRSGVFCRERPLQPAAASKVE